MKCKLSFLLFLPCVHGMILEIVPGLMEHFKKTTLVVTTSDVKSDNNLHQVVQTTSNYYIQVVVGTKDLDLIEQSLLVRLQKPRDRLLSNDKILTLTPSLTDKTELRLDSQVVLYKETDEKVSFVAVYTVKDSQKAFQELGFWTKREGMELKGQSRFWLDRTNLKNMTLTATVLDYPGFFTNSKLLVKKDDKANDIDSLGIQPRGFFALLLLNLQDQLGFKIKWILPQDQLWGAKNKHGKWMGMVGMLVNRTADIAPGGLSLLTERREAIDFSIPLEPDPISLWTSSLKGRNVNLWVYLNIFRTSSWYSLILAIISITFVYWIHHMYGQPTLLNHVKECMAIALTALEINCRALLQINFDISTHRTSIKIILLSTSILGFLIYSLYTAVLTSVMTIEPKPFQITRLQDILDHGYTTHSRVGSGPHMLLEDAKPGTLLHEIFHKTMVPYKDDTIHYTKEDVVTALLLGPKAVFWGNKYALFGQNDLDFKMIEEYMPLHNAFGFQKNSEFVKLFDNQLFKMYERGVFAKLRIESGIGDTKDPDIVSAEATSLGYDNVSFPFLAFAAGLVLSIALVFCEKTSGCIKWETLLK